MGIKLFHKGKRNITGHKIDLDGNPVLGEDGKPQAFVFKPNTAIEFDDVTGAKIKRLYEREVISMDDVQKQFDQSTAPQAPVAKNMHGEDVEAIKATAHQDAQEKANAKAMKALVAAGMTDAEAHAAIFGEDVAPAPEKSAQDEKAPSMMDRLGLSKGKA